MNGKFEQSGTYPLSTVPYEGYGVSSEERSGKVVICHVDGKRFIQVVDAAPGFLFVTDRIKATQFDDHATASLKAAELIKAAVVERDASEEIVSVD